MEYKEHPLASILPMMDAASLKELADDIDRNGLRAPITLFEGKVLDGRNRLKACDMVKVAPRFRDLNGEGDPLAFIISANVARRHLTDSQRALIAGKLANMKRGGDQAANVRSDATTVTAAAKELKVSPRSVATAKQVLKDAPKREIKAIETGEKTITQVARETKQAKAAKETHLDKTGYPIPESILADWKRAESFNETIKQLHRIKLAVEKALQDQDLIFREITNATTADLKNTLTHLQGVIPHAVCPTCQGHNRDTCTLCKQRGFLSKFGYEHWVPKKTREMREAKR